MLQQDRLCAYGRRRHDRRWCAWVPAEQKSVCEASPDMILSFKTAGWHSRTRLPGCAQPFALRTSLARPSRCTATATQNQSRPSSERYAVTPLVRICLADANQVHRRTRIASSHTGPRSAWFPRLDEARSGLFQPRPQQPDCNRSTLQKSGLHKSLTSNCSFHRSKSNPRALDGHRTAGFGQIDCGNPHATVAGAVTMQPAVMTCSPRRAPTCCEHVACGGQRREARAIAEDRKNRARVTYRLRMCEGART